MLQGSSLGLEILLWLVSLQLKNGKRHGKPQVFCLQASALLETPAVISDSETCKGGFPGRHLPELNLRTRSSLYARKVSQLLFQEF